MKGPHISLSRQSSKAQHLGKQLGNLSKVDALVGITQSASPRRGDDVTNAELMYIHTHGSPARNIPARPVIEPAISADGNRQSIADEMKQAAKAQLDGDERGAIAHLKRAGMLGMNAAKRWFTDPRNNWPPNKPGTRKKKGSDRPLIDTGALRAAITYTVRKVR